MNGNDKCARCGHSREEHDECSICCCAGFALLAEDDRRCGHCGHARTEHSTIGCTYVACTCQAYVPPLDQLRAMTPDHLAALRAPARAKARKALLRDKAEHDGLSLDEAHEFVRLILDSSEPALVRDLQAAKVSLETISKDARLSPQEASELSGAARWFAIYVDATLASCKGDRDR